MSGQQVWCLFLKKEIPSTWPMKSIFGNVSANSLIVGKIDEEPAYVGTVSYPKLCLDVLTTICTGGDQVDLVGARRKMSIDTSRVPRRLLVGDSSRYSLIAGSVDSFELSSFEYLPPLVSEYGLHLFVYDSASPFSIFSVNEINDLRDIGVGPDQVTEQQYYNIVDNKRESLFGNQETLRAMLSRVKVMCIPFGPHGSTYQFSTVKLAEIELLDALERSAAKQGLTVKLANGMDPLPWEKFY